MFSEQKRTASANKIHEQTLAYVKARKSTIAEFIKIGKELNIFADIDCNMFYDFDEQIGQPEIMIKHLIPVACFKFEYQLEDDFVETVINPKKKLTLLLGTAEMFKKD
jgi:uncharacterized membrane protein